MRLRSLLFLISIALFLPGAGCETMSQGTGDMSGNSLSDSGDSYDSNDQTTSSSQGSSTQGTQVASNQSNPTPAGVGAASNRRVGTAKFRKTIAVSRFEQRAKYSANIAMGTGMADQLADALVNSNNFVVVERQTLSDVIGEQNLAAGARMAKSKTAQIGKIVPAQILVKGTVTEFEEQSGGSGSGINIGGITFGANSGEAHVAVILRIIDTTSGQIIASERVEGKAKSGGTSFGIQRGGVGFGTSGFKKTPLGKAVQIAIDRAVVRIVRKLDPIPFEGKIIKASGDSVFTNIGKRNGVSEGDVFTVLSPGESMIDPDTGENLGSDKTEVGKIKISSVKQKFSKATIASGSDFAKGFILKEN